MLGAGEFSGAAGIFSGTAGIFGVIDSTGVTGAAGATGATGATFGTTGGSALNIESVRRAKSSITFEAATIEFPGSELPEVGA